MPTLEKLITDNINQTQGHQDSETGQTNVSPFCDIARVPQEWFNATGQSFRAFLENKKKVFDNPNISHESEIKDLIAQWQGIPKSAAENFFTKYNQNSADPITGLINDKTGEATLKCNVIFQLSTSTKTLKIDSSGNFTITTLSTIQATSTTDADAKPQNVATTSCTTRNNQCITASISSKTLEDMLRADASPKAITQDQISSMAKESAAAAAATIIPNPTRYDGHFLYQFTDTQNAFNLGGIAVSKQEALVRLGVMPDNNVLMNKVINQLGSRVLEMLRVAPKPEAVREKGATMMRYCADDAELLANWAMIDVLSAIKPIEQMTGDFGGVDCESIKSKLDAITLTLPDNLDNQLKADIGAKFEEIKEKCKAALDKLPTLQYKEGVQTIQRDLLRDILQDFYSLQSFITLEQVDNGTFITGTIANTSATEAVQNALYATQNHIYSAHGCTEDQLWMRSVSTDKKVILDTAQLGGIRQEDALFAANLLETGASPTPQSINTARGVFNSTRDKIQKEHKTLKAQIDHARETRGDYLRSKTGIGRDAYWHGNAEELRALKNTTQDIYNHHTKDCSVITPRQTAFVYHPGDVISAAGDFAMAFGEYFSKELAAKHPFVTTVGFITPQVAMVSAAFNVHFVPHMLQALAGKANEAWFWLTKAEGALNKLIMTGFAEPKIIYFVTEKMLKEMTTGEHQTTFESLTKLLSSGAIDTNTSMDAAREKAKTLLRGFMFLSLACAVGIGAEHLLPSSGVVGKAKGFISAFDNVKVSDFQSFIHASGAAAHGEALLQLFGVAQTAGFVILKVAGVAHFMRNNLDADAVAAFQYFIWLQDNKAAAPQISANEKERYRLIVQGCITQHPELTQIAGFDANFVRENINNVVEKNASVTESASHSEKSAQQTVAGNTSMPSTQAAEFNQPATEVAESGRMKRIAEWGKRVANGYRSVKMDAGEMANDYTASFGRNTLGFLGTILFKATDGIIDFAVGLWGISQGMVFYAIKLALSLPKIVLTGMGRRNPFVTLENTLIDYHPDGATDMLKVQLFVTKALGFFYHGVKFLSVATFGALVRVVSGVISSIGGFVATLAGTGERIFSHGFKEGVKFLGRQIGKAVTNVIVKPVQFVVGTVLGGLVTGVAALGKSLWTNTFGTGGNGIWHDTKQIFKDWRTGQPDPAQFLKDRILEAENKAPAAGKLEKGAKSIASSINRKIVEGALSLKNWVGDKLSIMRDFFIREPEEQIQQAQHSKQQKAVAKLREQLVESQPASVRSDKSHDTSPLDSPVSPSLRVEAVTHLAPPEKAKQEPKAKMPSSNSAANSDQPATVKNNIPTATVAKARRSKHTNVTNAIDVTLFGRLGGASHANHQAEHEVAANLNQQKMTQNTQQSPSASQSGLFSPTNSNKASEHSPTLHGSKEERPSAAAKDDVHTL